MKKLFTVILFLPFIINAANNEKVVTLKKIDTPIKIDGIIDEAWDKVDEVGDFFQLQPFFGKQPSKKTYAKVLSTETALYCLIVCYDELHNIQQSTGKLDDFGGDVVSIMLDTFGDKQTAYKFAVSASGVRADCRLLDDARNRDYSWDGIWFSDSKIYDWGFAVEIEIPYKSIQYNETLNSWGLDFDRWIPSIPEDQYWCEYEQNEGQRISKFGRLQFEDFRPSLKGLNLEFYPTAFGKITYLGSNKYKVDPDAGIDIFYNPSPQLTFQATANPDFAQIEADPFQFSISRYEVFVSERRPFFIQGNEIFKPSGKQRSSGFYTPLELFYSRRIGKILPDGSQLPITFGTKAFGRYGDWEYGGFVARTPQQDYVDSVTHSEDAAIFYSGRVKKQILDNSSLGILFVGKQTANNTYGVIDIDGAFRNSDWQLAYQVARSIQNSDGDFAGSAGFVQFGSSWINLVRARYVGENFDINQVGFVPWKGTFTFLGLFGPVWYPKEGIVSQILLYGGPSLNYEKVDQFTDYGLSLGFNMQFRNGWGYEINYSVSKSKDLDVKYDSHDLNLSSWFNIDPKWSANFSAYFGRTYNFRREYLAYFNEYSLSFSWKAADILQVGTSFYTGIEWNPDNDIEEIIYNARPWLSITPVNDLNFYLYVDNIFLNSTDQMERIFIGGLFSYQFSPKSWIYFALNEARRRNDSTRTLDLKDRISVFKIKYLYYL